MKAVVLAGGLGTRLQPYTLLLPKPMLPLGDKPILERMMEWLKENGIRDIIVAVGYMRKVIESYFGDGREFGVRIRYARSDRPLGTAGQLRTAGRMLDERFVLVYGDVLLEADLKPMIDFHSSHGAVATMMLMYYKAKLKYGLIETDEAGRIREWREKPEVGGWINVGCYVMEPVFLKYIPSDVPYGMDDAFRNAIKVGEPIYAYKSDGRFLDIGDRRSYREAYREFLKRMGRIP